MRKYTGLAVGLSTVAWLIAVAALAWQLFGIAMGRWAADQQDRVALDALAASAATTGTALAVVLLTGPIVIAGVAGLGGMRRTPVVFLVLAGLLAVPAGGAVGAGPPAGPPPGPATAPTPALHPPN